MTQIATVERILDARYAVIGTLYERFLDACRARGFRVEHGRFGAEMQVASVNDGPVTILFEL